MTTGLTVQQIQVSGNPSDYATNTSISDRDLDQLVARIKRHCPINEFRCYEAKREESEKDGSGRESNSGHLWLELPVLTW